MAVLGQVPVRALAPECWNCPNRSPKTPCYPLPQAAESDFALAQEP
jgi:hypothetical protein